MEAFVEGLREKYPELSVRKTSDGAWLVKVPRVGFGVPPRETTALVRLVPGFRGSGNRPQVYVAPGTRLSNGTTGRNVTSTLVEGEPWLQFSFSYSWRPTDEPWKLVASAVRRFLQNG